MGPSGRFYSFIFLFNIDDWDRLFLVRAPCTRETLPDFCESGRVTRHSRVFPWVDG